MLLTGLAGHKPAVCVLELTTECLNVLALHHHPLFYEESLRGGALKNKRLLVAQPGESFEEFGLAFVQLLFSHPQIGPQNLNVELLLLHHPAFPVVSPQSLQGHLLEPINRRLLPLAFRICIRQAGEHAVERRKHLRAYFFVDGESRTRHRPHTFGMGIADGRRSLRALGAELLEVGLSLRLNRIL